MIQDNSLAIVPKQTVYGIQIASYPLAIDGLARYEVTEHASSRDNKIIHLDRTINVKKTESQQEDIHTLIMRIGAAEFMERLIYVQRAMPVRLR